MMYRRENLTANILSMEMMTMRGRLLYEASVGGNVTSLKELLEEDSLILDRVITSFSETPLHIAAMYGHVDFAKELLNRKPELASESDTYGFVPLHLASSRKNVDMVKLLLLSDPDVCNATDQEGRTPLHLAAMKGRIEAMKELINTRRGAIQVVADRGETILHLCVKYNRLEALKLLLEELNKNKGGVLDHSSSSSITINSKDGDGNTILHLAVAKKHWEMINFLLNQNNEPSTKGIEVNALNNNGLTSLDVLIIQSAARDFKDIEIREQIRELLGDAGCVRANSLANNVPPVSLSLSQSQQRILPRTSTRDNIGTNSNEYAEWVKEMKTSLIVVATLLATMAFQAGLTPPGGLWTDDASPPPISDGDYYMYGRSSIGTSILANSDLYSRHLFFNTIGFVASLSIILLLLSGLPLMNRRSFVWILVGVMWTAITSMTLSFTYILKLTGKASSKAPTIILIVWMVLMDLLFVSHLYLVLLRCFNRRRSTNYTRTRSSLA